MAWKLKSHTLAILSRIPAGHSLYHTLQRWAGTNRLNLDRDLGRAFELVDLIQEAGKTIEQAHCLEIGTGWRPFVPFVFFLAGAKKITTLDVNPWLTLEYAREAWQALQPRLDEIAARCGVSENDVVERYWKVPQNASSLNDLLMACHIDYHCPADAACTGLVSDNVDIVFSSNVLEHIPFAIQQGIHQESLRVLKDGGISVHRFNPQDHYSTVDAGITNANFLRYSEKEWHWYGGSGLAYHNRLRAPDYRDLFQNVGFQLEVCKERVDQRSLRAIQGGILPVHESFNQYTPEELAVDYMWVVAQKPDEVRVNDHETQRNPAVNLT